MGLFGNAFTRSLTPTLNALAQPAPLVRQPVPAQQQMRAYYPTPADKARNALSAVLERTGQMSGEARRTAENVVAFSPLGAADDLNSGALQTRRGLIGGSKAETLGGILSMAMAGVPVPKPVKKAGGILEEFMRDGSERFLTYQGRSGHVANLHVKIDGNGLAEISVDPFSKEPNRFGIGAVRDAAQQLRSLYPEIKGFTGERLSGANPGRQQTVSLLSQARQTVGALPSRNLAPANIGEDGAAYVGREGGLHFEVMDAHPNARFTGETGFVTPDGQYLTREQALQWVNNRGEVVRPSANTGGGLDALDYREQRRPR